MTNDEVEAVLRAIEAELRLKLPGTVWILALATAPDAEVRVSSSVQLDGATTVGMLRKLADSAEAHGVKLARGPRPS